MILIVSAWPGIGGWVRGWWLGIGEGSADTLWVEARDSAEHPRVLREALTIKDQPAPNVRSASIERLWISVFFPVYPPAQVPWLCLSFRPSPASVLFPGERSSWLQRPSHQPRFPWERQMFSLSLFLVMIPDWSDRMV